MKRKDMPVMKLTEAFVVPTSGLWRTTGNASLKLTSWLAELEPGNRKTDSKKGQPSLLYFASFELSM